MARDERVRKNMNGSFFNGAKVRIKRIRFYKKHSCYKAECKREIN
jgi:hypothetical protein